MPSADESWIDIVAASGSSPSPEKDRPSSSPSRHDHAVPKRWHIVVIEDNKADVFLVKEAIADCGIPAEVQVITDGEEAIRQIEDANRDTLISIPNLFILDLNLPKRSGHEILAYIRQSAACAHVPVLIMTSSSSEKDRREAARLGCNGYFRKPTGFDEFLKIGAVIKDLLVETL